jgi:peptide/nickel transport system permease protein
MTVYIARRLAAGLVLVLAISFIAFLLLGVSAPDVGRTLLGINASPQIVAAKNASLGLDRPLMVQYLDWLGRAVRGDLGSSWFTSENVVTSIGARLPVTLSLVICVTLVTAAIGFPLGVWAAVRGGAVDRAVQILGVVGYALPGFLVTLLLVIVFAVNLRWFPAIGYIPITASVGGWASTITLPVIALSIGAIAGMAQQVRSSVLEVTSRDFVRTLRTRGIPSSRILWRHVLRNASAPPLTIIGLQFVGLLGGAVLVEQIFGLPGIGSMTVNYTVRGDVPVIMGLLMVSVVGVVIVNLIVDVAIGVLNPKARVSA